MARIKRGVTKHRRHKKILRMARGYFLGRSKLYKSAHEAVMHALAYSYRDRRNKKRDMRRLWVMRINAAARLNGLSYSRFMDGLRRANVTVDRKMLADLAVRDAAAFSRIAEMARPGSGQPTAGAA
ncbi:MAG TPA: 50S ribosomal protein L20 [Chloroflexota bacterium]|jgi:large subunit ribosomal protein L20|nr:50S ribosomal protein L20 [Chloroflexota bacterium]